MPNLQVIIKKYYINENYNYQDISSGETSTSVPICLVDVEIKSLNCLRHEGPGFILFKTWT